MRLVLLSAAAVLLIGCNDDRAAQTDRPTGAATGSVPAAPGQPAPAQQPIAALGLTMEQLEDADILDSSGREIGEVESAVMDGSRQVTGLLVEIEDTDPDRYVTIPLTGLTAVQDGHDRNLRSTLTREQLLAMPETRR